MVKPVSLASVLFLDFDSVGVNRRTDWLRCRCHRRLGRFFVQRRRRGILAETKTKSNPQPHRDAFARLHERRTQPNGVAVQER
jgi:hypothetical protein